LKSSHKSTSSSSSSSPASGERSGEYAKAQASPSDAHLTQWEKALAALASRLAEDESLQHVLWWSSDEVAPSNSKQRDDGGTWARVFTTLHRLPPEEVVERLRELGIRPWQAIWRHLVVEFHVALQRLQVAARAVPVAGDVEKQGVGDGSKSLLNPALWQDACQFLMQACSGNASLEQFYTQIQGKTEDVAPRMSPQAIEALQALLKTKRRLLRLQEQLAWLARIVTTALAREELHEQLLRVIKDDLLAAKKSGSKSPIRKRTLSGGDLLEWLNREGVASTSEKLRQLALIGFELQGVCFRLVVGTADWRIVRAELRRTQSWEEGVPSPGFFTALEGLGIRLVAVPALPLVNGNAGAEFSLGGADLACQSLVAMFLEQRGLSIPAEQDFLSRWCSKLPNPRGLTSVVSPLHLAMLMEGSQMNSGSQDIMPPKSQSRPRFLALCFGGPLPHATKDGSAPNPQEDLTIAHCANPVVVMAESMKHLLHHVAAALQCDALELRRWEDAQGDRTGQSVCDVFGCFCECWYCPPKNESRKLSSVWNWGSDSFALLLVGPVMPRFTTLPSVHAQDSLSNRLDAARNALRTSLGFPRHPRAVRSALRAHGVPLAYSAALADPHLYCAGCKKSEELAATLKDEAVEEVVGADLLACASKQVVRALVSFCNGPSWLVEPAAEPPIIGESGNQRIPITRSVLRREFLSKVSMDAKGVLTETLQNSKGESSKIVKPVVEKAVVLPEHTSVEDSSAIEASGGYSVARNNSQNPGEQLGAIERESPIPPMPESGNLQSFSGIAVGALSGASMATRCSPLLEMEFQHILSAFELHPDLDSALRTLPHTKQAVTCRLGFIYIAFWTRLASVARELDALRDGAYSGDGDNGYADASVSGKPIALPKLILDLGRRLLQSAWKAPPTLVRATCSHLRVELAPSVFRRLRPTSEQLLAPSVMKMPDAVAVKVASFRVAQGAYFSFKAASSLETTIQSAMCYAGSASVARNETNAVGALATATAGQLLVGFDIACQADWRFGSGPILWDWKGEPSRENLDDANSVISNDSTSSARSISTKVLQKGVRASDNVFQTISGANATRRYWNPPHVSDGAFAMPSIAASLAGAICVSQKVQDTRFLHHQVQRARDLLRCAQWLLFSLMWEMYLKNGSHPLELPDHLDDFSKDAASISDSTSDSACVAHVLATVVNILQLVAVLVGDIGTCPAEILVTLWTLRGYVWEKRSQVDACFIDYLQALSMIDDAWGDPRKRGGRGHPFALFLAWKLGLISYCRGDGKSIDKFADYFRSLTLHYATCCPFTWGPPAWPNGAHVGQPGASIDEKDMSRLLWANEACLWTERGLWSWWRQHDALNFTTECFGGPAQKSAPSSNNLAGWSLSGPSQQREIASAEGSIASDLQEVRRGTIFAFGSNQFGQLGVGRPTLAPAIPAEKPLADKVASIDTSQTTCGCGSDLWWSGRPARVMALKECRVKDIACGESHCVAVDLDGQAYAWGIDEMGQVGAQKRHAADIAPPVANIKPVASMPVTIAEQVSHLPVCLNPLDLCNGVGGLASLGPELALASTVPLIKYTAVACGARFSLALDRSGGIWAWGNGEGGVLGLGVDGLSGRSSPAKIEALSDKLTSSMTCGSYHAMAVGIDGKLHAWGRAEGGQLGLSEERVNAHIEEKELNDTCVCEPLRVLFSPERVRSVSSDPASNRHSKQPGVSNDVSEGDDLRAAASPEVDDRVRVKQVACGDVHSCTLDSEGRVWSWGWGEFGQLGLGFSAASYEVGTGGITSKRLTPEAIDSKYFDKMKLKSVACGGAFSAAIAEPGPMTSSYTGNLFLWGANEVGQCTLTPKKPSEVVVPTKAQGLVHTMIRSIACGASHVVAVDVGGRAYSWGAAQYGQLGASQPPKTFSPPPACESRDISAGVTTHQHQPTLIQSVSRLHIMKAACGLHHSLLVSEVSPESSSRSAARNGNKGETATRSNNPSNVARNSADENGVDTRVS